MRSTFTFISPRALASIVSLWALSSCGHSSFAEPPPSSRTQVAANPCRFGANYGSGMVAMGFTPAVHEALVCVHDDIITREPYLIADFMSSQPYQPHTTLVYGVTSNNRSQVVDRLKSITTSLSAAPVKLGRLNYWDDVTSAKTTLVAEIIDPSGVLSEAHAQLQSLIGPARYRYTPHVTLAYLKTGARLTAIVELEIEGRLSKLAATPQVMWLTDACGIAGGYEALPRGCEKSPGR